MDITNNSQNTLTEARGGVEEAWIAYYKSLFKQHVQRLPIDYTMNIRSADTMVKFNGVLMFTGDVAVRAGELEFSVALVGRYQTRSTRKYFGEDDFVDRPASTSILYYLIREYEEQGTGVLAKVSPTLYVSNVEEISGQIIVKYRAKIYRELKHNTYPENVNESLRYLLSEARGGVLEAWVRYFRQKIQSTFRQHLDILIRSGGGPAERAVGDVYIKSIDVLGNSKAQITLALSDDFYIVSHIDGTKIPFKTSYYIFGNRMTSQFLDDRLQAHINQLPLPKKLKVGEKGKYQNYGESKVVDMRYYITNNLYPTDVNEATHPLEEAHGGVAEAWRQYVEQSLKKNTGKYPLRATNNNTGMWYDGELVVEDVQVDNTTLKVSFIPNYYKVYIADKNKGKGRTTRITAQIENDIIKSKIDIQYLIESVRRFGDVDEFLDMAGRIGGDLSLENGKLKVIIYYDMTELIKENIYPSNAQNEELVNALYYLQSLIESD
jgi:hypothetical protein